jgi:hypothetical protein
MKLIIDQYSIQDSQLVAAVGLQNQSYAALAGLVNGIVGNEVGPLPGFIVQTTTNPAEVELADGVTLSGVQIGIISSDVYLDSQAPAAPYQWAEAGVNNVSVIYLPGFRGVIEAYASQNEADTAALTYAIGDELFRSTYGCLTKDNATSTVALGVVVGINSDGSLDVILN